MTELTLVSQGEISSIIIEIKENVIFLYYADITRSNRRWLDFSEVCCDAVYMLYSGVIAHVWKDW